MVRVGGSAILMAVLGGSGLPAYASTPMLKVGTCYTGAWATIQDAVDAIPASGDGKILVCPGLYPEAVNVNNKGKVSLVGKAGAYLIAPTNSYNGPLLQAMSTTSLTVQSMSFDGITDTGGNASGIALIDTPGVLIGNSFANLPVDAIFATSTTGSGLLTVTKNTIVNATTGIWVNPSSGGVFTVKLTGNTLKHSVAGGGPGIRLDNNTRSVVSGNTITNSGAGILIFGSSFSKVSSNKIYTPVGTGIAVESDSAATPANNNVLSGNQIYAAAGSGISISALGGHADGNILTGNRIADTAAVNPADDGITVTTSGAGSTITGLQVKGTTLTNIFLPWSLTDPVSGVTGVAAKGNKCLPAAPCIPVLP